MIKKSKRSVTTELFCTYSLGYIAITVIIVLSIFVSMISYGIICSEITYSSSFKELDKKLQENYLLITDEDLSSVNTFVLAINNKNEITYSKGKVIGEFKHITLESYMYLFGLSKENTTYLNYDFRAMSLIDNFNNSIIETKDNIRYALYSRYLKDEDTLLIMGCPYSEVTKPNLITRIVSHTTLIKVLSFSNLVIILSVLYVFAKITANSFVRPIKILLNGVMEISHGNYDIHIDINKKNEFLDLSNGFNMMAETIKIEKKEKEKLEKMREELVLDISHDLKNPLASILGYSETLLNDSGLSEEEKVEYLNIINKNSYRANALINNLFEFSLYENSDYKLVAKRIDVCEFFRERIADYIAEFECKEFEYEFDILEGPYYVMIDEDKLERAINNIFDNKVKYNSNGNKIFVKTRIEETYFYILIGDNGESIPKEYRENLFNPFVRLDKSRNSNTGGTGLGLSISQKIINKHNGDIKIINSEIGVIFEIKFPLVR